MPIYEYQCGACGHQIEAFQKMSDAPLTICPSCQKPNLTKLMSASGFQLKGTGWYVTDFKDNGKKQPKTDKKDTIATETKDKATTVETKPSGEANSNSKSKKGTDT
jgi:putative FmdB family regulatory protein